MFSIIELAFLETSALTGENVEEVFQKCTRSILTKIDAGNFQQTILYIYLYYTCPCMVIDYHYYTLLRCVILNILLIYFIAGELDPDRVGSGIQYGNASVRRVTQQGPSGGGKEKCSC